MGRLVLLRLVASGVRRGASTWRGGARGDDCSSPVALHEVLAVIVGVGGGGGGGGSG